MRIQFLTLFLALTTAGSALVAQDSASKWIDLFNGKDFTGWTQRGGVAKYSVEDGGVIVGTTAPNTPNSFMCTEKNYGDFVLEVEFKVDPAMNSGVQIRSNSLPDYKDGRVHGYQVEIDPSRRGWSGGIYDEGRRGWLNDLRNNLAARYAFKQNDWNHYRVEAIGDRIRTWVNGIPAADLKDDMTAEGFIALQVHGIGKRTDVMQVRWRNIRIQENPKPSPEIEAAKITADAVVFPENAAVKKLGGDYKFTEGPALGPDGRIYFNDIPNERTHVYDPKSGEISVHRENTGRANGLFFAPNDALIFCEGGNRKLTIQEGEKLTTLSEEFKGKKLNSPNDVAIDSIGGIYFTDPRYGKRDDMEMEVEGVYYVDRSKNKTSRLIEDLERPNGVILSPDFKTLYVADQAGSTIMAYDVVGDGKINNPRKFAPIGSDGFSIDVNGNLYVTWEDIVVFSPAGKEIGRFKTPEKPANCLLVGTTLYVTARTGFYAIENCGVPGLAH